MSIRYNDKQVASTYNGIDKKYLTLNYEGMKMKSVTVPNNSFVDIYTANGHCRVYLRLIAGDNSRIVSRAIEVAVNGHTIIMYGQTSSYSTYMGGPILDLQKDDVISVKRNQTDSVGTLELYIIPFMR